jgi:hypothetical protein
MGQRVRKSNFKGHRVSIDETLKCMVLRSSARNIEKGKDRSEAECLWQGRAAAGATGDGTV